MIEKPQVKPLLWRTFDAEQVGAVMNHTDVRPHIGPGPDVIDPAGFLADPRNIALFNEHGGFLFHCHAPGVYEVHTQFLKSGRGRQALEAAKYAAFAMFTQTDCMEIFTKIQADNKRAIWLTEAMGFDFMFEHDRPGWGKVRYYVLGYQKWVATCEELPQMGHWFHERLEEARGTPPGHDDDPAHDRYVGAAVEMIMAGNLAKAVHLYSRWAVLAGYARLTVLGTDPLVLHIGDGTVTVREGNLFV